MARKDLKERAEYAADYYKKNGDKIRARARRYYAKHKKRAAALQSARRAARTEEERAKERARHRKYRQTNPERYRAARLRHRHGISLAEWNALAKEQDHKCAICRNEDKERHRRRLSVDHDHKSGKRRGLLCSNCNKALGCFQDNPEFLANAIAYLARYA